MRHKRRRQKIPHLYFIVRKTLNSSLKKVSSIRSFSPKNLVFSVRLAIIVCPLNFLSNSQTKIEPLKACISFIFFYAKTTADSKFSAA